MSLTEKLLADPVPSARIAARTPMGKVGVPDDLAGAMLYLGLSRFQPGDGAHPRRGRRLARLVVSDCPGTARESGRGNICSESSRQGF